MKTRSRKQASRQPGRANVYAGLGYRDAWIMPVKAQLVSKIAELLAQRRMPQARAATVLGIPQPELAMMLRGQFRDVSLFKLMKCFTQLGYDVSIVIRPRPDKATTGTVSVTFE